jgi:hypothetical protein
MMMRGRTLAILAFLARITQVSLNDKKVGTREPLAPEIASTAHFSDGRSNVVFQEEGKPIRSRNFDEVSHQRSDNHFT